MVFVGKNKVILGSDVRLVRVCRGIWILFLLFVGKNKGRTGGSTALRCVWFGKIRVERAVLPNAKPNANAKPNKKHVNL